MAPLSATSAAFQIMQTSPNWGIHNFATHQPCLESTRRDGVCLPAIRDGERGDRLYDKDDINEDEAKLKQQKQVYKPPGHSDSFLRHLEQVKSTWPSNTSDNNDDKLKTDANIDRNYGVYCTGEPSIDPSRMIQAVSDGESDWI